MRKSMIFMAFLLLILFCVPCLATDYGTIESAIQRWNGLSTSTKPVTGTPSGTIVKSGSIFYESDTGDTYRYINDTLHWTFIGGSNPSKLASALPSTVVTTNTPVVGTAVLGIKNYKQISALLTVSGKSLNSGGTVDIFIQYSPDGVVWDDLAHFAQMTSAAVGNGTYVMFINSTAGVSAIDRATTDGTLAAATVRSIPFVDRIRVKVVPASLNGTTDTITLVLTTFLQ